MVIYLYCKTNSQSSLILPLFFSSTLCLNSLASHKNSPNCNIYCSHISSNSSHSSNPVITIPLSSSTGIVIWTKSYISSYSFSSIVVFRSKRSLYHKHTHSSIEHLFVNLLIRNNYLSYHVYSAQH